MFDQILQQLAPGWREVVELALSLIAWIPEWQRRMLAPLWAGFGSPIATFAGWLLLVLPAALLVVGMWSTMLSTYTLPFRSGRGVYLRTIAFTWWDAGRGIVMYWAGIGRLGLEVLGLLWSTLRYAVVLGKNVLVELVSSPAAALDWTARRYFKPGMPWVAFVMIIGWSMLEGAVFTFTLRPTMTEVLHDLTGAAPNPAIVTPILYLLLTMLIAGSFACIQVLTDAIKARRVPDIMQMLVVELFVMFFEVIFLYRELIDAVTPWIAQQSGEAFRLGLWSTLALASFGWMGIRGMTWFLFGRFGTPALLAILSRQTLTAPDTAAAPRPAPQTAWWTSMMEELKRNRQWFHEQGNRLVELAVLPVLQLLAVCINFVVVLISSRPAFALPFTSLEEAMRRLPAPSGARSDAPAAAGSAARAMAGGGVA